MVLSYCDFNFNVPDVLEYFYKGLLTIYLSSFVRCLCKIFVHFISYFLFTIELLKLFIYSRHKCFVYILCKLLACFLINFINDIFCLADFLNFVKFHFIIFFFYC